MPFSKLSDLFQFSLHGYSSRNIIFLMEEPQAAVEVLQLAAAGFMPSCHHVILCKPYNVKLASVLMIIILMNCSDFFF